VETVERPQVKKSGFGRIKKKKWERSGSAVHPQGVGDGERCRHRNWEKRWGKAPTGPKINLRLLGEKKGELTAKGSVNKTEKKYKGGTSQLQKGSKE